MGLFQGVGKKVLKGLMIKVPCMYIRERANGRRVNVIKVIFMYLQKWKRKPLKKCFQSGKDIRKSNRGGEYRQSMWKYHSETLYRTNIC
jgi:hypothetical protein